MPLNWCTHYINSDHSTAIQYPNPSEHKPVSVQVEGVAYRGRIMVKVEMTLGSSPAVPRELLGTLDKEKSMVSMSGHVCLFGVVNSDIQKLHIMPLWCSGSLPLVFHVVCSPTCSEGPTNCMQPSSMPLWYLLMMGQWSLKLALVSMHCIAKHNGNWMMQNFCNNLPTF